MKKEGVCISDWYFGERMEANSAGEKGKKSEERQNFVQKLCVHRVNEQMNKP